MNPEGKDFSELQLTENTIQFLKKKFISIKKTETIETGKELITFFLLRCGESIANHPVFGRYTKN